MKSSHVEVIQDAVSGSLELRTSGYNGLAMRKMLNGLLPNKWHAFNRSGVLVVARWIDDQMQWFIPSSHHWFHLANGDVDQKRSSLFRYHSGEVKRASRVLSVAVATAVSEGYADAE